MTLKILAAASLVALAGLAAPAFSAEMMACDDANIMKMEESAKMMTDQAQMDMAMKEVDMAKMAMKDGKKDDCAMHLDGAMKATMAK